MNEAMNPAGMILILAVILMVIAAAIASRDAYANTSCEDLCRAIRKHSSAEASDGTTPSSKAI